KEFLPSMTLKRSAQFGDHSCKRVLEIALVQLPMAARLKPGCPRDAGHFNTRRGYGRRDAEKTMTNLIIASLLAVLTGATVVLVAGAKAANIGDPPCPVVRDKDERAPFWPGIDSTSIVDEWYSDVPWHQKLGTFAGNEIIAPLIIP